MSPPPPGRAVRRWTRRRTNWRSRAGLAEVLSDVYIAVMIVAMYTAMVLSVTAALGTNLAEAAPVTGGFVLAPGWLAALAGVAVVAAVVGLAARLGPVALAPPEARWWLPLPVDRRTLLRPVAVRWPALATVPGGAVAAAVVLVLEPRAEAALMAGAVVSGAAVVAAGVLAAGLSQSSLRWHRRVRRGADLAVAAVPVLGIGLAAVAPPAPSLPATVWPAAVAALLLAGLLAVVLDTRLDRLRGTSLRERGAVAGEALGAVLSLDTRALGRALTEATQRAARPRSRRLWRLGRVPRRWAAHAALVTGDALLLTRTPRHLVQLIAGACLPALALTVPQPVPVVTVLLLVVGAYVAGLATADGARRAQVAPVLDALLPLGQKQVRRLRLVTPTAVLVVWSSVVFALLGWRYGDMGDWLALGVLAAPVWAAAAVRAAYRPLPDFSGPLVHTPMGAIPPGMGTVFRKGPDVVALGTIPLVIAVVVGTVTPVLLAVQAALTAVSVAIVARPEPLPSRRRRAGPEPGATVRR